MTDFPLYPDSTEEEAPGNTPPESTPLTDAPISSASPFDTPVEESPLPQETTVLSEAPEPPVFSEPQPEAPVPEPQLSQDTAFMPELPVEEPPVLRQTQPPAQDTPPYYAAQQPPVQAPFIPQQPQQPVYPNVQQPMRPRFDPYTGRPIPPPCPPPKKSEPKKNSKGLTWRLILIGLCFALVGSIFGGLLVGFIMKPDKTVQQTPRPTVPVYDSQKPSDSNKPAGIMAPPANLSDLYDAAVPSIVGIKNEFTTYNYFGQGTASSSTGTGFIISSDGEILTNYHVIENAETLTVTMYDGTQHSATILGYEAESDVALIKIDATDLPAVVMGDSDALMVGEQITAIGNPLGELTYTMTVGYVSAKSRAVYTDERPINMMQIDAAINPGNSGGPLFNLNGEVVGITTAKYSGTIDGSATIEGIGFAIPINDVLAIVDDLREYGSVQNRAYIGVTVTNSVAGGDIPAGALVQSIEKGSAGDLSGLRLSDIITAVGDSQVYGVDTLYQALRPYRGGDSAVLTVFRSGETLTLTITFGTTPAVTQEPEPETVPPTEVPTEGYGFPWDYFFP